jgi:hypothetical protein
MPLPCLQCTICSTASESSSDRSITPVSASKKELRHAPSKNDDRVARRARCTGYLFAPQTIVRSEYMPEVKRLYRISMS